MHRRTLLSLAASIAIALVALLGFAPERAYAQQDPNCCDFIVNATRVPASCFPLALVITWGGGVMTTETMATPGYYSFHIPNCPLAPPFLNATVANPVGCCLRPIASFCGGCLFIDIIPC
jgi:hypothetical protein